MLEAARRRQIDVVLVCRLERWGRSVADLLATLQELEHLGVGFVSLIEALDLTTPAGRAMAGLLAVFAANAERAIMQSQADEWAADLALLGCCTAHNYRGLQEWHQPPSCTILRLAGKQASGGNMSAGAGT